MIYRLLRALALLAFVPSVGAAQNITSCKFTQDSVYYKLYGAIPTQSLTVLASPGTSVKITGTAFLAPRTDTIGASGSLNISEPYTSDKLLPYVGKTTTITALCADPVTGVGLTGTYKLVVEGAGAVNVSPAAVNLSYVIGSYSPLIPGSILVNNSDGGFSSNLDSMSVSIVFKQGAGWLQTDTIPSSARAPLTINLSSNQAKMDKAPVGLDTALVIVSSIKKGLLAASDTSYIIVRVWAKPVLAFTQGLSVFKFAQKDPAPKPDTLGIINGGVDLSSTLGREPYGLQNLNLTSEYAPGSEGTWLQPTLIGTATPGFMVVAVDTAGLLPKNDLEPRTYTAFITLSDGAVNVSARYEVRLVVYPPKATISLSRSSFSYTLGIGEAAPRADTVAVSNSGAGAQASIQKLKVRVVYQGTAPSWLVARLSSSITPTSLIVQPVPGLLPKGIYQATIYVEDSLTLNQSVALPVTLTLVEGAVLKVDSTSVGSSNLNLAASATEGQVQTATATAWLGSTLGKITDLKTNIRYISSTGVGTWLTVTLSPNSTPAVLTVVASAKGLAAGTYNAQIDVSSSLITQAAVSIPVKLTVTQANGTVGALVLGASEINLAFTASDTLGRTGQVSLGGMGAVSLDSSNLPSWLSASLNLATLPAMITVKITGTPIAEMSSYSVVVQGGTPSSQKTLVIKVASLASVASARAVAGLQNGDLTTAEKTWLDGRGNRNGRVDIGDIAALLLRNP